MNAIEILLERITQASLWQPERQIKRGQFLKTAGTIDSAMYVVDSGCFRLFVADEEEDHTIRFGYAGNLIGALDSFLTGEASEISIQAIRKSSVRPVTRKGLRNLVEQSAENQDLWIKLLEQFVVQQMQRERDILIYSPLGRYERVLKRSPHLFQEVPHRYIASYLRMTPETLSRIRKS